MLAQLKKKHQKYKKLFSVALENLLCRTQEKKSLLLLIFAKISSFFFCQGK
jgi:hypothetical protein